jgi:hypothetical protein
MKTNGKQCFIKSSITKMKPKVKNYIEPPIKTGQAKIRARACP